MTSPAAGFNAAFEWLVLLDDIAETQEVWRKSSFRAKAWQYSQQCFADGVVIYSRHEAQRLAARIW